MTKWFLFLPGNYSNRLKRLVGNSDLGKYGKEMDEERKKRKLESKDKTWNERRSNTGGMYVDYETALLFMVH